MPYYKYSDGHQACFNYIKRKESFWNVTLTISKEKYVVLNCPGYTVCWSVSASIFVVVFVFPQLTARVVLKLQLQLLVLNGWEYENICVHTYGGRQGSCKDVIRITNHSWQLVDVHRWWFQVTDRKSDFVWKLYRHPEQSQALPSNTAC